MKLLRRLCRAEYIYQPLQLPRRVRHALVRTGARPHAAVRLAWGLPLVVDPRETIGRSILDLNALDLPVTETIWRLLESGEYAADVGANIGYMTSVMAARLRQGGTILAFEPLPELAGALRTNVRTWAGLTHAQIHVHEAAVSERAGNATIYVPSSFAANRGVASLAPTPVGSGAPDPDRAIQIRTVRLDSHVGESITLGVLKIDVEGFEREVLDGAVNLLRNGQIRDIVLEEYGPPASAPSLELLRAHGYQVFRVTREWNGPALRPSSSEEQGELDPPTYLATRNAERATARFAARGWFSLKGAPPQ